MFEKTAPNEIHHLVLGHMPDGLVEDFNFNWTSIAGRINQLAELAQFDHAVAHHRATHENAWERHGPVGNVKADYPSACPVYFCSQFRIPPDVEGIDHDSSGRAR